jgi:hypothetical protein
LLTPLSSSIANRHSFIEISSYRLNLHHCLLGS